MDYYVRPLYQWVPRPGRGSQAIGKASKAVRNSPITAGPSVASIIFRFNVLCVIPDVVSQDKDFYQGKAGASNEVGGKGR